MLCCEIELAKSEVTACSQGSPHLPSVITEEIFSLEWTNGRLKRPVASIPISITVDNNLSPSHTLVQIFCPDHKGLVYDIMRTLKDYNIQVYLFKLCGLGEKNILGFVSQFTFCLFTLNIIIVNNICQFAEN